MPIKVKIDKTENNLGLIKRFASRNAAERLEAQESFASWIGPVINEVILAAPILANLFTRFPFAEGENPGIPLDTYTDLTEEDYITIWSQVQNGGMPYSQPMPPSQELKFQTFNLDSAFAIQRKWAERSRLDVLAKTLSVAIQQIILKRDRNAAALLLKALAQHKSKIKQGSSEIYQVIRSNQAKRFLLDDINKLFTLQKRVNSAWNSGTPSAAQSRGLTDLLVSPEIVESIRSMAYNPINTKAGVISGNATTGSASSVVTLTDAQREQIYRSAGIPEFYGVGIMEINELGIGQKYNDVFDVFAGSNTYVNHGDNFDSGTASAFDATTEELLIGLDLSDDSALVRPVITDRASNSDVAVMPDDQFSTRSGMVGFFMNIEEGYVILNAKTLSGLIV